MQLQERTMTPQQRREYIAEKILKWKKEQRYVGPDSFDIVWHVPSIKFDFFRRIIYAEFTPGDTFEIWDYQIPTFKESIWVGPICEVIFPLFAEHGISINFHMNPGGDRPMFYLDDGSIDPMIPLDRYEGPFYLQEFIKRIVDAHIKITGEK